ncbi:1-acyl-sn-glycerol-3-phosphate acyltransferase, partial [Streptomyces sp. NPDC057654]
VRPKDSDDTWWVPAHLGGSAPTPAEAKALDRR